MQAEPGRGTEMADARFRNLHLLLRFFLLPRRPVLFLIVAVVLFHRLAALLPAELREGRNKDEVSVRARRDHPADAAAAVVVLQVASGRRGSTSRDPRPPLGSVSAHGEQRRGAKRRNEPTNQPTNEGRKEASGDVVTAPSEVAALLPAPATARVRRLD